MMLSEFLKKNLQEARSAISVEPFFSSFLERSSDLQLLHAEMVTQSIAQGKYSTRRSLFFPDRGVAINLPDPEMLRQDVFDALNELPPSQMFRVIHRTQGALASIPLTAVLSPLKGLLDQLGVLEHVYENYLSRGDLTRAIQVIRIAANLRRSFREVEDWTLGVVSQLIPKSDLPPRYASLTLLFEGEQSFDSLRAKLQAIEELYSDFSGLIAVDVAEFPLQIRDLQYGSLWVDVIGNEVVIGLIASAVTSSAVYLYRRVHESGKLPRGAQQLEQLLRIREKMKQQGLDTSASDEELQHVFAKISRNLNTLVGGEPVVEVNGERFSLVEKSRIEYLSPGDQLLLEGGDPQLTD